MIGYYQVGNNLSPGVGVATWRFDAPTSSDYLKNENRAMTSPMKLEIIFIA
jgi:hypothetical protein